MTTKQPVDTHTHTHQQTPHLKWARQGKAGVSLLSHWLPGGCAAFALARVRFTSYVVAAEIVRFAVYVYIYIGAVCACCSFVDGNFRGKTTFDAMCCR